MQRLRNLIITTAMVMTVVATATAAQVTPVRRPAVPRYELTIVSPAGMQSYATAINDAGMIAANCYDEQWRMHGWTFGRGGA